MWIESEEDLVRHLEDPASREGLTMDYKRDLDSRDKKKVADVVETIGAMANAEGGQVLIGIDERNGAPVREVVGLDAEDARKRLENALDASLVLVEPRPRVSVLHVEGKEILVVRVLPSVRLAALWASSERDKLRYPLRTGQGIDYMRAGDVEARILSYGPRAQRIAIEEIRQGADQPCVTLYYADGGKPGRSRRWENGPTEIRGLDAFGALLDIGQSDDGKVSASLWVSYQWITPFLTRENWRGAINPSAFFLGLLLNGDLAGPTTGRGLRLLPRLP